MLIITGLRPDQIFYVPQKPYNVLGTLFDQVTYPRSSSDCGLTEQRLRELLSLVDLDYLFVRCQGRLHEEVWGVDAWVSKVCGCG